MDDNTKAAQATLEMAAKCLELNDSPQMKLKQLWWALLYMRVRALAANLRRIAGDKVMGGPFKGMLLTNAAINGYRSPALLGIYEHELHPTVEKIIAGNYTHIVNIGCSVGYYAVGLARRMPHVLVEAFDIDLGARTQCADLAQLNGVEDRVRVSGEFRGGDFDSYAGRKVLVLMDIEGAETGLLDPVKFPVLRTMDVIVELHDILDPAISKTICDRFVPSHKVELIRNRNIMPDVSDFLSGQNLDYIDQLLLGWEGRDGATPWGVFWANAK